MPQFAMSSIAKLMLKSTCSIEHLPILLHNDLCIIHKLRRAVSTKKKIQTIPPFVATYLIWILTPDLVKYINSPHPSSIIFVHRRGWSLLLFPFHIARCRVIIRWIFTHRICIGGQESTGFSL
jgi:hypothetical protein